MAKKLMSTMYISCLKTNFTHRLSPIPHRGIGLFILKSNAEAWWLRQKGRHGTSAGHNDENKIEDRFYEQYMAMKNAK